MRARVTTAAVGLVLASACGTTVPVTSQVATGDNPRTSALGSGPVATTPGGSPLVTAPTGETPVAAGGATGSVPGSTTSEPADVAGSGPSGLPAEGRGWTKDKVYVGVITNQDLSTVASTVGISSLDSGNQKAEAEAAIATINSRGGVFGRKLVGIYLDIPTAQDSNTSAQAACTAMTQDHKVVAVVNGALENDNATFRACMTKADVPVLAIGGQPFDDVVYAHEKGNYFNILAVSWNRLAPALVQALADSAWFTGWDTARGAPGTAPVKLGLLVQDNPNGRRVGALIAKALTAKGHAPASTVYYATQGTSIQQDGLAALSAAVTRFRADGVTHVISADQFVVFFMSDAESQGYRPRYGLNSLNAPSTLIASTAPAAQLVGSVGLGFSPSLDVEKAQEPPLGAATASCRAAMRKAGLDYSSKRFADGYGLAFCDLLQLVVASAERGGGLTGHAVRSGLDLLDARFPTAATFRSGLGRGVRSLPGAGRVLRWGTDCACFAYAGALRSF